MLTKKCKNCKKTISIQYFKEDSKTCDRCSRPNQIDDQVAKLMYYHAVYDNNELAICKIQKELGLTHRGAIRKWQSMQGK